MNTKLRLLGTVLVVALFLAQSAAAGTILGITGMTSYPVSYSTSSSSTISVYGDWIETIGSATTTSPGVSVGITAKYNGLQNQTEPFKGRGKVALWIVTNNATPGNKTIKLSGGIFGDATFTITVQPLPTVTNVNVPTPAEPFKEIIVTFTGTGLQDAADPASGTIVQDNLIPLVTVGGNVMVSSVRVLNSTNTSLQAKVFFNGFVQDATVELRFRTTSKNVPLINGLKRRVQAKSSNIKNYVKSITFPNGMTFDKNSIATINLNLLFPAPGGVGGTAASAPTTTARVRSGATVPPALAESIQRLAANALANSRVYFKLVPANAFEAVPNGTPFNPNGFSEVRANSGDDIIPLSFKVIDCLGGRPGQSNVVKIQTWMHSTNTSLAPNFIEATFNVRCP
ncbi:MAG: hypothetical protein AB1428_07220 [Bacteroidota bacterium]